MHSYSGVEQRGKVDFYCARSLKQQSTGTHTSTWYNFTLIQPVFSSSYILNAVFLEGKQHILILWSLVWLDGGPNPQYTALGLSTLADAIEY